MSEWDRHWPNAFPSRGRPSKRRTTFWGMGLSRLAWEGPLEVLTATENAQPALYVHSLAVYRVVRDRLGGRLPRPRVIRWASSRPTAPPAPTPSPTVSRAVRRRGELMARAGDSAPGTMAAVLGLDERTIAELCEVKRPIPA